VISREIDEQGQSKDWVLVSTSAKLNAQQIRSTYKLRTAIEERHRQYKCFWDLTRMHSCAFSLVVNQVLFVLLTYTLFQAHLLLRQRQRLNRLTRTSVLDLLTLEELARKKLRNKIRRFEQTLDGWLHNPRPP